jgi:alkyl sulfatase BDS1-like metallo-beta-lactamase superfamily hydrolase
VPENLLEIADRMWRGEISIEERHPFSATGALAEIANGTAFVSTFANVSAFATEAGLVLVDTGSPFTARLVHEAVRGWSSSTLHTAVFSHGHIDHVFGVGPFEEEEGARPRVVAHEAMPARFERYVLTAGYNAIINRRQFGFADLAWPTEYRYPDATYRDRLVLDIGGERFELHHARGETDDHTWTWAARRKVLCCGDLFIWASPNAGNPQKVQRYPREWAAALREMAGLGAEVLLPGHGMPVIGADRVRQALGDTASLLESLHDQTVALMNEGSSLNDIIHAVRAPSDLLERSYLRPVYDDPEFIVRNVWRLYGGWYDGNPSSLKPARDDELASEIAALAGGADRLATRAAELAREGKLRLAAHLAELAARAAPDDAHARAVRADVYERRAAEETSLMAKGIFSAAARESRDRASMRGKS